MLTSPSIRADLLVVAVLWCCAVALADPRIPQLPDSYYVAMEHTHVDTHTTDAQFEWYDYEKNAYRIDEIRSDANVSEIFNVAKGKRYTVINALKCIVSDINADNTGNLESARNHIRRQTLSNLTAFSYLGPDSIRGINVDVWLGQGTYVVPQLGTVMFNSTYSFATADWVWRGMRNQPILIRHRVWATVMENATASIRNLYDEYHYFDYKPGPQPAYLFGVPSICPGAPPHDAFSDPDTQMAVVGVFCGLLGFALGAAGSSLWREWAAEGDAEERDKKKKANEEHLHELDAKHSDDA